MAIMLSQHVGFDIGPESDRLGQIIILVCMIKR